MSHCINQRAHCIALQMDGHRYHLGFGIDVCVRRLRCNARLVLCHLGHDELST